MMHSVSANVFGLHHTRPFADGLARSGFEKDRAVSYHLRLLSLIPPLLLLLLLVA